MALTELKPLKPFSDSTKVRAMLPEIEAALARRITREQVLEKLKADGVVKPEFGLRGLDTAILRERKLRAKHPERATRVAQPEVAVTVQPQQVLTPKVGVPKALAQLSAPESTEMDETKLADTKADSKATAARYKALAAQLVDNPDY